MADTATNRFPPPMVLVGTRQTGRTTQAFNWLSQGVVTRGYPGWSRVLVVTSLDLKMFHRHDWFQKIEDYAHRVYDLRTWCEARITGDVEVCLDDYDRMGAFIGRIPGRVVAITLEGFQWEDQEYDPSTALRSLAKRNNDV